jgi:predicted Zn-dependent protease
MVKIEAGAHCSGNHGAINIRLAATQSCQPGLEMDPMQMRKISMYFPKQKYLDQIPPFIGATTNSIALMKIRTLVIASLVALAGGMAHSAADIESSAPSVATRLINARKAIDSKEWRNAGFELDKAEREDPGNADVHNMLGYYYRKRATPDLTKAFEHYKTALRINPGHRGANEYIGEAYLMVGKPQEAEIHLARLQSICGNQTCEEYEDLAKAIGAYKAANK